MSLYLILVSVHILLIVTWLGMDIGLFTSSFYIRNSKLSPETRLTMGRFGGLMDMGPRSSLPLIFGVGILLSYYGNWAFTFLPQAVIWLIVALLLVWLWAIWQQYWAVHDVSAGHQIGRRIIFMRQFRTFDMYLRLAIGVTLVAVAIAGAIGALPDPYGWLNLKLALFGIILFNGIAIRFVSDDFPIALGEIVRLGSTPEREDRLNKALKRAYPFVLGLWTIIVIMTIVAVTKPF